MLNHHPQQEVKSISETPLSSNTTKRNHFEAYSLSDDDLQHNSLSPPHSETLFVVQNDLYLTGKPTYETVRVERRTYVTTQLPIALPSSTLVDSRGNLSSLASPKSLESQTIFDPAEHSCGTTKNMHNTTTLGPHAHELSQITAHAYSSNNNREKVYGWCSSFMIKVFTLTNVFILMFIVQGMIGIGSSFILSLSSGENILSQTRQYQRLQLQVYLNSELQLFISHITSMTNHISKQMTRLSLNDNIAMVKMLDSIDTIYNSKVGSTAYRWARFDDFYFARQYNDTVDGYVVRLYNPLTQNFKYYNISKESMLKAPSASSSIDLFEYLNRTMDPYYNFNTSYYPKKREYYLPFDLGNQSATDTLWTNSWTNYNEQIVITLSIPVFSNYSMSFFKNSNNSYLTTSMLHPKYLSIPYGNTLQYPNLKNSQYLFGVLSIQFSWEAISATILNSSNSGIDILNTKDRLEYSLIVDSKYDMIGKNTDHNMVSIMYEVLKRERILNSIFNRCGNMTTNSTDYGITTYGTVFFVIHPGTYGMFTTTQSIEVEIAPICDKFGIDWFVVVGNYRSSFVMELNRNGEFVSSFLLMLLLQFMFLIFGVVNIKLSFSAVKKTAISILKLTNKSVTAPQTFLVKVRKAIENLTFFVDIRDMKSNLSKIRMGLTIFSNYVPEIVVKAFTERDGPFDKISLAQRDMTILCTELVGIPEHCDTLPNLMSHYFTIVSQAVKEEGGMTIQFIGDRAVCVFNVYCLPLENHEIKACRASLKIRMNIENFNRMNNTDLKLSASITSSDNILCGNTGSQTRMNATVIGSSVNIAKALMFLNKHVGKKILIHEATYLKVCENFVCNFVDYVSFEHSKFPIYSLESIFCLMTDDMKNDHEASLQIEAAFSKFDFKAVIEVCKKYEHNNECFKRMRKRAEILELQNSMWDSCEEFDSSFKLRVK